MVARSMRKIGRTIIEVTMFCSLIPKAQQPADWFFVDRLGKIMLNFWL